MKIALIGTHDTGKTTLAYSTTAELKKLDKNATMITEVARQCPLPINEQGTINSQLWIICKQIEWEVEAEHKFSHVVCDRSVFDGYAYNMYSTGQHNDMLKKLVDHWIPTYDALFKAPIQYKLRGDGFRSVNKKFQTGVDDIMTNLLQEWNIEYIDLPKENQEKFVLDHIKSLESRSS